MFELTIKNYRCFPDSKPVRLTLTKGFTAFLGVNNSGKSSLLRFFYEFRTLFQLLSSPSSEFIVGLAGQPRAFQPPVIDDMTKLFHRRNERDIRIHLRVPAAEPVPAAIDPSAAKEVIVTVLRPSNTWSYKSLEWMGKRSN